MFGQKRQIRSSVLWTVSIKYEWNHNYLNFSPIYFLMLVLILKCFIFYGKKEQKYLRKKKCFSAAPPQVICLQQGLYESEHKSMQAYRKSPSLQECYFSEKFSKHMNISGYICLICLVLISCTSSPTICWVCSLTVWSHTNWTPLWFTSKTPVCSNR